MKIVVTGSTGLLGSYFKQVLQEKYNDNNYVYLNRSKIKGLKIIKQPKYLRHFTAKLKKI